MACWGSCAPLHKPSHWNSYGQLDEDDANGHFKYYIGCYVKSHGNYCTETHVDDYNKSHALPYRLNINGSI